MTFEISIIKKDEALEISVAQIYRARYTSTGSFKIQSPAFKELTSFANSEGYPCEITPEEYAPLILKFETEKSQLEESKQTSRGKDAHWNLISLYDVVEGCYNGLRRAQELGANLRIH